MLSSQAALRCTHVEADATVWIHASCAKAGSPLALPVCPSGPLNVISWRRLRRFTLFFDDQARPRRDQSPQLASQDSLQDQLGPARCFGSGHKDPLCCAVRSTTGRLFAPS